MSGVTRKYQSPTSPIAIGGPAPPLTPDTLASSSVVRDSITVGSPSLPIDGSRIVRETQYPMYEFQQEKGVLISTEFLAK